MSSHLLSEGQPSRSALMVARLRAAHQLLDTPAIFDDPLALPVLGPEDCVQVQSNARSYDAGFSRILRAAMAVRSRFAEDELARAAAAGVRQYVVLGAGLDTFACRHQHDAALQVFEVDHPATQAWKRGLLAASSITVPDSLRFVPVDFERDALADALRAAGCRLDQPVFFSWLGVTLYLTGPAIFDTLRLVASLPPAVASSSITASSRSCWIRWKRPASSTLPAVMPSKASPGCRFLILLNCVRNYAR